VPGAGQAADRRTGERQRGEAVDPGPDANPGEAPRAVRGYRQGDDQDQVRREEMAQRQARRLDERVLDQGQGQRAGQAGVLGPGH